MTKKVEETKEPVKAAVKDTVKVVEEKKEELKEWAKMTEDDEIEYLAQLLVDIYLEQKNEQSNGELNQKKSSAIL